MDVSQDRTMVTAVTAVLAQVARNLVAGLSLEADTGSLEDQDFRAAALNVVVVVLLVFLERGDDAASDDLALLEIDHATPHPFQSGCFARQQEARPVPLPHMSSSAALLQAIINVRAIADVLKEEAPDMTPLERAQEALQTIAGRLGVEAPDARAISTDRRSSAEEEVDRKDLARAYRGFAVLTGREADVSEEDDCAVVRALLLPVSEEERWTRVLQEQAVKRALIELERAGEVESRTNKDGEVEWRLVR